MAAKILGRKSGTPDAKPGNVVVSKISMLTQVDGTTFIDLFEEMDLKLWDANRMIFTFDHIFQPDWIPQAAVREHPKIKKFAKKQGVPLENIYDLGRNGVSHHIAVEQGYALPGAVCIGSDTQSSMMGAVNCFSLAVSLGVNQILMTGDIWLVVPEVIRVNLSGAFRHGVNGKDFVYRLIKDLGDEVNGRVIEFSGPGVSNLSIDVRMAIANGAVQIGALTIIFPYDDVLETFLQGRAREAYEPAVADVDAEYVATFDYDLETIEQLIAGPHEIDLVRPLSELVGQEVTAAYIGSCSSGRLSDLVLAAEILRGRKVHPSVRLIVTPVSAATARAAANEGLMQVFLNAGATVTQPGCGACYSGCLSPLKLMDGERCISSSVETLRGRMGSREAEILLGNAAVVAASAIEGKIADPGKYLAKQIISQAQL